MSARVIGPDQNDARPGHIHNTGQVPSAHHARCSFRSAESGTCRLIYGGVLSVSVSGDLRDSRGIVGATEQPVQIVASNSFGAFVKALRSLPFPRINSVQEPLRGLSKRFENLLRFLAHGKHKTTGADEACSKNQTMRFTA